MSSIRTCVLAGLAFMAMGSPAIAGPLEPFPNSLTVTTTGTIKSGLDTLDLFGGGNLAGDAFTSIFTIDHVYNDYADYIDGDGLSVLYSQGGVLFNTAFTVNGITINFPSIGLLLNQSNPASGATPAYDTRSALAENGPYLFEVALNRSPAVWSGSAKSVDVFQNSDFTGVPYPDPSENRFGTDRLVNGKYVFEFLDLTPTSIATSFTTALAPVPEPSGWMLGIMGMGAIGVRLRSGKGRGRPALGSFAAG